MARSKSHLRIEGYSLAFRTPFGASHALRGATLEIAEGEAVGVVGESGCGKTMLGRSIVRLLPATAMTGGSITFGEINVLTADERTIRRMRGRRVGTIFQDPAAALNPVFTVGEQMSRVLRTKRDVSKAQAQSRAAELVSEVGLASPRQLLGMFPHQLSGGMQQRVMIAIAISMEPALIVADEPTTALDVTIQAQILELLTEIRGARDLALMLISHNLDVVSQATERVAVLYAGQIMETGPVQDVMTTPRHPYTQGLLAGQPGTRPPRAPLAVIPGHVPGGEETILGCPFVARCAHAMEVCIASRPTMRSVGTEWTVACWLYESGYIEGQS